MYEDFYNFNEKPFQIVPNPGYLYKSDKHQNALTYLEYGLSENVGFILLTGEIGSGKTTLIQYVLNEISDNTEVAVIFNTNVSAYQLLLMILNEFELSSQKFDKTAALDSLNQYLIQKYAEKKRVLLIIAVIPTMGKSSIPLTIWGLTWHRWPDLPSLPPTVARFFLQGISVFTAMR